MAYSLETSSVKTIVPGAEVSGFADVVARQKITALSGEVPQLSAGEGIDISTVDGKTVITNNISAGENISLVYDMETNTYRIDSNAGGGDVVSPYGTLITNVNSAEASISGVIPEYISSFDTVSSNTVVYANTAVGLDNTINLNSANTVFFSAYESQWVQGNVVLSVYENDEQITSFEGTSFNFSTAYSEPTNVKLTYIGTPNGVPLTATISSNYNDVVPAEIVNLYEVPQHTQSAIDSKSQIGVIMGSTSTAYTDIYNPAKNAKLIISGERSYAERGRRVTVEFDKNGSISSLEAGYLVPRGDNHINTQILSNYYDRPRWVSIASITSGAGSAQINYLSGAIDYVSSNAGLYTGIDPIQVDNTEHEISITGESLSAGPGIDMFSSGGYVVVSSTGKELSAGPGIDLFESGGYFVISGNGGNVFPMTGTDGTANYTANANFSSFTLTTGQGAAGCYVNLNAKGVHFEAYPATDVSASWYSIITQQDKITCSAVKLSTASDSTTFYTSAVPNLNKITFIAPSYGPYETYSALIDDGDTIFCSEVDSGCCRTVVRCWNDDRNKNCWCGLNQETYFYIG